MKSGAVANTRQRDVVMLSTADWDHPFWTNKQHVASAMAKLGHRVLYIESVGLRPPRLEAQDLRRIWRRLRRGLRPPRRVSPGIWVWSPLLLPAPRTAWQRACNRFVFSVLLSFWRRWLGFRADLLWTYNPLTAHLHPIQPHGFRQLVYHCVDDLTAQPCMPSEMIRLEEERLCRSSDWVFVTSPELFNLRSVWNARTSYYPNVADVEHFERARDLTGPVPGDLQSLPAGPRLGFIGAISGYKVDFELLAELSRRRSDVQIVLIGRVGEGDPETLLDVLEECTNIHLLGPRSYRELPDYLRGFDLALLPCPINAYTCSMFPMKFFEYLAAGVPVVATNLPALFEYRHLASLCTSSQNFLETVDRLLDQLITRPKDALSIQLDALPDVCSYEVRTQRMLRDLESDSGCSLMPGIIR